MTDFGLLPRSQIRSRLCPATVRSFFPSPHLTLRMSQPVRELAVRLAGPVAKVAAQHYFSKKREELVVKQAEARSDALAQVSDQSVSAAVTTEQRIDELIQQETCSTCQMALAELKSQPEPQMDSGLRYYMEEYKPAREAFDAGRIDQQELQGKTEQLLDVAGL